MQILSIVSLCAALISASATMAAPANSADAGPTQANSADESAIRAIVDGFAKSWDTPGMPGFEDLFTQTPTSS